MPVITLRRTELFKQLGESFTDDEFSDLCFKFGIELDEIHAEDGSKDITGVPAHKIMYKIEIPANRYDLLCIEGLSRALRIFRGRESLPHYKLSQPATLQRMVVRESVKPIRAVVVCAVLRGMTFTPEAYNSFIELQEKLHENICRKRTLVSIGTHDLDTIAGPFSYEARAPHEIVFAPLNKTQAVSAAQLMLDLAADTHLKKYLHIIQHLPAYPVIYDAQGRVLSLPPIINGDHSKITLQTRNVLIEVTAVDQTKALTVLDTMVAMFAQYCAVPFEVEPVEIAHESGAVHTYPQWGSWPHVTADAARICKQIGVEVQSAQDVIAMLRRMSLPARASAASGSEIIVDVPPTRSDVIAACDVMEDVAIGYGFERLIARKTIPATLTSGRQQPLNKLTDQLRQVLAWASYDEVLTFGLCSRDENFAYLNKADDGSATVIGNPKTQDFQIARTTLLSGLLKTLQSNKGLPLPLRVFEVSDVVLKDAAADVGAVNRRMLCAVFQDMSSGFENIHGLLDTIMTALEVPWKYRDESKKKDRVKTHDTHEGPALAYEVLPSQDDTYFPGKRGDVYLNDKKIGVFGILHPEVLKHFKLTSPCSAIQIEIEHFV